MKIVADRDVCIGAGLCVGTSETVFDQDDDGIVLVLVEQPEGADADGAREAASLCPSGALRVIE
jgi:ferredoxin